LPGPPRRVSVVADGLRGTHKNWWECDTGIAYLVSGKPGWRVDRMTSIVDDAVAYLKPRIGGAIDLAVVLGTLNVVGGFVVTDRMLEMFKKRKKAK